MALKDTDKAGFRGGQGGQKADSTAFSVTASKHKIAFLIGIYYCQQLASL